MFKNNIKWDLLKTFHAIAQSKSISDASTLLRSDQSSVSRNLKNLETALKVQLFTRDRSGVKITKQGKELYKVVDVFVENLNKSLQEINQSLSRTEPVGEIVIYAPFGFGTSVLSDYIKEFVQKYPKIQISLTFCRDSITESDIDVYFLASKPENSKLDVIPFFTSLSYVFASKKYLEKHGTPKCINNLDKHYIIRNKTSKDEIINTEYKKVLNDVQDRVITVNSFKMAYELACRDTGISILPDYMVTEKDELVRICNQVDLKRKTYYMAIDKQKTKIPAVLKFQEFLLSKIDKNKLETC